jgi:homocysteine S-methyltransferase
MTIFTRKKYVFDGGMGQALIENGMITNGTLWSATALVDETLNNLVVNTHLDFIKAGAEIIITNNFKVRKNVFNENNIIDKFDFANKIAGELAFKAKKQSNNNILIGGSIPTRGITYQPHQQYDNNLVYEEFYQVARELDPYVDFFYLDVLTSTEEINTALSAIKPFKKPSLLGLHFKDDFLLPSDESIKDISNIIKNYNCEGFMASCVSPEIYNGVLPDLKSQNLPYGFAINAFINVPEKIELNKEFSLQPNNFLGLRKELTPKKFSDFCINAFNDGAKFLKGCCNILPKHIKKLTESIN